MSNRLTELHSILKKNKYILAAFFVPLLVRSIPEILSWPYPLGLDTLRYIPIIQNGTAFLSGAAGFFKTHLFYSLATLLYWQVPDAVLLIKIFGPLLLSLLSVMMYLYAKRVLRWSGLKSFLVALLVGTYFVSLRISWDLYSQTLGLIFLLAALIALKSFSSPIKYCVASVFMVFTVLSHELAAVILFFVVGLEAVRFLVKKLRRDFAYLVVTTGLAGALFLFQRYSSQAAILVIPIVSSASEPSLALALHIGGLLVYCYVLVLPLVALGFVGLKDSFLRYWLVLCVGIPLLTMVFPTMPLYYWNRWAYLLVYPLLFYAVHGFEKLWMRGSGFKSKVKRLVPKVFAVAYLCLLLTFSGYYLTTSPENAFSYYSQDNPYLAYIPSSMLQNTVSITDTSSLVTCIDWLNDNTAENSVIVAHYALYDLTFIYIHNLPVVPVRVGSSIWAHLQNEATLADGMIEAAKDASVGGSTSVYTVWWVSGKGWYGISSLPSEFREVYRVGSMAVYLYSPRA